MNKLYGPAVCVWVWGKQRDGRSYCLTRESMRELVVCCDSHALTGRYTGWKSMFSAEFLADPGIKAYFNRALDLMNHAVSGTHLPGMRENVAYFTSSERRCDIDSKG